MNSYVLSLSSNATSAVEIRPLVTFDDHTTLRVNLSGLTEAFVPVYLKLDWGDGQSETINNSLYKVYREESILNEVIYGKFSSVLNEDYLHSYYPSSSARYKCLSAQVYLEYADGNSSWFVQPIKIVTRDYFESIYDIRLIDTNLLPLSTNNKQQRFSVDAGGFLIEMI
jgi:hypothetical protein